MSDTALLGAEPCGGEVAAALHDDTVQVMFGAALILEGLSAGLTDRELAVALREVAGDLSAGGGRLKDLMRRFHAAGS